MENAESGGHLTEAQFEALGASQWLSGRASTCYCRRHQRPRFDPWVRKIPWRRKWQPTPVFLPGHSHRKGNLAGYSLWGHKEQVTNTHTNTGHLMVGSSVDQRNCNATKTNKLDVNLVTWPHCISNLENKCSNYLTYSTIVTARGE